MAHSFWCNLRVLEPIEHGNYGYSTVGSVVGTKLPEFVPGTTLQIDVPGTAQCCAQAIYVPIK